MDEKIIKEKLMNTISESNIGCNMPLDVGEGEHISVSCGRKYQGIVMYCDRCEGKREIINKLLEIMFDNH